MKICPKCNFKNSNEAKFCRNCGYAIIYVPITEEEQRVEMEEKPPAIKEEEKVPEETTIKMEERPPTIKEEEKEAVSQIQEEQKVEMEEKPPARKKLNFKLILFLSIIAAEIFAIFYLIYWQI